MTDPSLARVRVLRIALLLTGIFNVLALLVFLRDTPVVFTVFMFLGLMLFVVSTILLLGAVLADLRAKKLL
jgi:preprotein translocase subunit SecF